MEITLKQVNRLGSVLTIDTGEEGIVNVGPKMSLSDEGYYSLTNGTYIVYFNERYSWLLFKPNRIFTDNGIEFGSTIFKDDTGFGTIMKVSCPHLRIKPGVLMTTIKEVEPSEHQKSLDKQNEETLNEVITNLTLGNEYNDVSILTKIDVVKVAEPSNLLVETTQPVKRKPGRPPKNREAVINA